ncbi:hypothetical protein Tco_1079786 [Tanacetum coccineum]|uniref:Uncharacterized protein n=1 Tax=Tanacetum coccineum TaxID=301880 RepID=A0ABQ5HTY3_9ASTR
METIESSNTCNIAIGFKPLVNTKTLLKEGVVNSYGRENTPKRYQELKWQRVLEGIVSVSADELYNVRKIISQYILEILILGDKSHDEMMNDSFSESRIVHLFLLLVVSVLYLECEVFPKEAVYFIWQERNFRLFRGSMRSAEMVTSMIIDTMRLRLLSLKIKHSCEVLKAVVIWNLPRKAILDDGARSTFGSSNSFGIVDISIGMTSSFFRPYTCDHPVGGMDNGQTMLYSPCLFCFVEGAISLWMRLVEVGWLLVWVRNNLCIFGCTPNMLKRYGSATYSSSGYGVLGIWGSSFFGKGLGSVSGFMDYGLDCISLYCDHFKGPGSGLWKCNTIFIIDKGLWMDCIVFWSSGFMVSMVIWHQGILRRMIQWAYIHGRLPLLTSKGSGYDKTSEFANRGYEDSASKYKRSKKDFKWSSCSGCFKSLVIPAQRK